MYVLGMWHARMKIFLQIPEGDFNGYNSNFSLFTLIYTRIPTVILIYHWPHENGFPDDSPEVVPRDDPVSEHQRRPEDGSGWTNQTRYTNQQQVETTVTEAKWRKYKLVRGHHHHKLLKYLTCTLISKIDHLYHWYTWTGAWHREVLLLKIGKKVLRGTSVRVTVSIWLQSKAACT